MEFKSYTVKVKTPSQWEEFHNTLLSSSSVNHIPDREVTCSDDKKHSPTRGTYLLTDDEANDLREHHFVDWIELCPTCNPDEYRKPELAARRFKRNIKVYRDLFLNAPADPTGSVVFDGNGDSLSTADNADFEFGSGDFTVEGWIYLNSIGQNRCIVSKWGSSGGQEFIIRIASDGRLNTSISNGSSTFSYTSSQTLSTNTWYHFAAVKNGPTDYKIYIDGVVTLNSSLNFTIPSSSNNLLIGSVTGTQQFFDGKISNLRIVKGSAVYTSNFTVPTKIDNITNTVLLCCSSASSVTAESTGKTITTIGNPTTSRDNPGFKFPYISDTVTPAVTGSVDFDGNGDSLSTADNADFDFETGDFTIELFTNNDLAQSSNPVLIGANGGWYIQFKTGGTILEFYTGSTSITATGLNLEGAWHHIAVTKQSNSVRIFVDGVLQSTTANSDVTNLANTLYIGNYSGSSLHYLGYISNVRIVKGTALYTSNFTVPTEKLEVISTPNLVANGTFDDASSIDDWVADNSIVTWDSVNGRMKIQRSGGTGFTAYLNISTVPGRTYTLKCDFTGPSVGSSNTIRVCDGAGTPSSCFIIAFALVAANTTAAVEFTFTALSTTSNIRTSIDVNGQTAYIDNLVVQEYATSLLCCQSPTDATEEATGKTITVNGNATASTESPGLLTGEFDRTYNSPEVIRTNWGVQRVGLATNGDFWTGTGDLAPEFTDIGYNMTGKNVDIIIQDSGVLQYHPEFMDGKGQSRVRDIVLDGPLYLDPTSSYLQANTYTKADGRIGIATTAAHNWWNNNSSGYRSADFDATGTKDFGTLSISSTYEVDNTLGESLDGTSGITDGHGTACAGLSAGKNAGAAFEANIWNMSGIDVPSSLTITIEQNHDLMKIFHKYKPINPQTGIKNPTIINGSWGYFASFTQNGPVSFNFRGTSGTYSGSVTGTGNDLLGKAMVDGLRASDGNRSFAVDSGSSATETAADELMAEGPIYIAAAGNNNQMLGIGADDPDRLNTIGSFECNHRDFMHPQGIGFDSVNDYHPVICIGAMDDEVETNYEERKADYSNNGPGVDVWSPADSTLAPGLSGDSLTYMRHDDTRFYDRYFNGTSAAAPVTTGVLALYLQSNPRATQKGTKKWLNRYGSKIGSPYRDDETDDQTTSYWTGSYNMRGAEKRILFNPYYTDASKPQPSLLSTSGLSFGGVSISVK